MSQETQAVYILRRILQSDGIGVEHSFIYDFKDDGTDPYSDYENFGLVKNDRSPKESYFAVQRLTGLLAGMRRRRLTNRLRSRADPASKQRTGSSMLYLCQPRWTKDGWSLFGKPKPWEPNAAPVKAVVTLPLASEPAASSLYDLLSGKETQVPWKRSEGSNRISITVPISATPKLLIAR